MRVFVMYVCLVHEERSGEEELDGSGCDYL